MPATSASHPSPRSRLADARSAYLRSAAEQAIDWYPWGEEAFRRARETGRPILLDIGASWCHWCHVMDEGTYADDEVARLLRQHFVAVKVDRDEHPEVDRRFQQQVSALSGEGGWPLTGFLTPDGEVFLGGTYFPPTDGHGRPGFRRVLKEVARLWREEPERIGQNTKAVQGALARLAARRAPEGPALGAFAEGVVEELGAGFDPVHGGFGGAPKFPHPIALELLLWDEFRHGHAASGGRARETLLRMADGGLYDQLGGGFHRYSVDEGWHVPHFEKMGVDNAELLSAYVAGWRRFHEPRFEEVVRGTIGWVTEVLGDPAGGWKASQDADNAPGDDGGFFTWSRAELRGALAPEEYRLLLRVFGVDTEGRMPHAPERSVLFRLLPLEEAADGLELSRPPSEVFEGAVRALRTVRARRPAPPVDPALYASINGRFVAAFARAAAALGEPSWLDEARRAADRFLSSAFDPARGVAHRLVPEGAYGFGLLDDQASFASGLLELAAALGQPTYLERALDLLGLIDREFRGEDGLLRDVAPSLYDGPRIGRVLEPSYPLEDTPHLSGNAASALAFLRAAALLHDATWEEKARGLLAGIVPRIGRAGIFAAGSALAAGLLTTDAASVVVEGTGAAAERLVVAARSTYHPSSVVFPARPPPPFSFPAPPLPPGSPVRALVCFGTVCGPPLTSEDELVALLARGAVGPR